MRLKADLHHVNVGKDHFIIDPDGGAIDLTDLYAMNEAAAYLWEQFSNRDFTPQEMALLILLPTFLRGEEQFFYGMHFNCNAVTL